MNFHWTWILWALIAFWCTGWLVCTFYMFFFGMRPDKKPDDWKDSLKAAFWLSAFLWPVLLPGMRGFNRFQRGIKTGKRPSWLVRADGERGDDSWSLADGTEFWASPVSGSSTEPTLIQAGFEGPAETEAVEFRVRMIAPDQVEPTEWKPMRSKRPVRSQDDEDDEEADEPFCEAPIQLARGKHQVDFRVQLRGRTPEEPGSVVVIVAEPEDHDF
jgi:hypothetical protein